VVYELTPLGRSLEQPIRSIAEWAEHNIEQITAAREAYDGAAPADAATAPSRAA
jgi:DNA-binding HxlR family transcriptional regulator